MAAEKSGRVRGVFFGILALFLVFMPGLAGAEKPIKIGLIDVYSGAGAAFGKPALNGWKMAVEEFNEKGGLNWKKDRIARPGRQV